MANKKQGKSEPKGTMSKGKDLFFDNCPICRAMKAAQESGRDLSENELREAFAAAKENGVVVGGVWFDKNEGK